jgi:hypothetical protein
MNDLIDKLFGAKIISNIDLKSGHQQIWVYEPDIHKMVLEILSVNCIVANRKNLVFEEEIWSIKAMSSHEEYL